MTTNQTTQPAQLLVNGAKVIGEVAVVPGASLIVDGDVKSGLLHAGGAILGVALLGPILGPLSWFALGADSYSKSISGRSVVDQFQAPKASL